MKKLTMQLAVFMICVTMVLGTQALEVVVKAENQSYGICPISVNVADAELPAGDLKLVEGDRQYPCQRIKSRHGATLNFVLLNLKKGEERVFQLKAGKAKSDDPVLIEKLGNKLGVSIGGDPFTNYILSSNDEWFYRPIFYPLHGPEGKPMTRNYPMQELEGERKDHPHHQSLWVAHGDINKVDFWAIGNGKGKVETSKLIAMQSGPVCGQFLVQNNWNSPDGDTILREMRKVTVWGTDDSARFIDLDLTFRPAEGDVVFGDTKEGGLVSLRTAHTMKVDSDPGGHILNSRGDTDKGAWGKAAPWCDYYGPVDGITAGMTIMDHPENPFHPTHYHVRTYGLFTANPFGLSYFIGKEHDGTQTLKKGEAWHFHYRVYIHKGDTQKAKVANAYSYFAEGVTVSIQ